MAASLIIKHFTDGVITLTDGTGTPVVLTVPFSQGDFSLSALQQTQQDVVAYQSRGELHSVRLAAKNFPTGSLSFMVADYSDGTNQTALDFLLKTGSYATNVTTLTNSLEVYTVDITLTVEGTDHGDPTDHVITVTDCDCTVEIAEGEPNTASVSFIMYGAYTAS
tara:strand:+ start:95 stop:589 length:495 start_codon:yes stop_codon:yes gene_type:complete